MFQKFLIKNKIYYFIQIKMYKNEALEKKLSRNINIKQV